jgi:hypothetical protein
MMRIVQTPQLIVMLNPDLTYRQIWMDGRKLETNPNPRGWATPSGAGRATRWSSRASGSIPARGSIGTDIRTPTSCA